MRTLSLVAVCAINLGIGVRYCWLVRRGRISPALAMWVFFTVATVGSLLTYLGEGRYSPLDNILNTADILLVGTVAVWIALYGDRSTRFTRFDLGCLVAVTAIVIAWAVTREHAVAHSAIQAILVIAYFPVVRRLWRAERNTESFTMWIGLLVAPAFSLLSSQGVLATVYAVRAIVCTGLLLLLMLRAERRARAGQAQFAR
ncbi:hypothetical protein H5T54_03860 [Candidatus Bipolaricaulota bacterium]|nr:hypothetical protein [Candidatus Bipolaricaulota bacterium]